jgi:hypothetical protein
MDSRTRWGSWILMLALCSGCRTRHPDMSSTINEIGVSRTRAGDAPAGISARQFVAASSLLRVRTGDIEADAVPETIIELGDGRGVEIRDASGARLRQLPTTGYLTDFGTVATPGSDKQQLVLYTYPNANRGGTFSVVTADGQERARWDEAPAPGGFAVGQWGDVPALFYLQDDRLAIQSPQRGRITTLSAPQGGFFTTRAVRTIASGRTVVLASGNGYTPYHVVCVYDAGGRLVFEEVGDEQAFELEGSGESDEFFVLTRSSRWRFNTSAARPG